MKGRSSVLVAALAGAAFMVVVVACSSSKSSAAAACNAEPFQCGAGQTCWLKDCVCPAGASCDAMSCTPEFSCQASISGKQVGSLCSNAVHDPTCGDGQTCLEFVAGGGKCAAYCDDQHPCPTDFGCKEWPVGKPGNPTIHACTRVSADGAVYQPPPQDGGADDAGDAAPIPIIDIDAGPGGKPA
jgi:hypothetical protein